MGMIVVSSLTVLARAESDLPTYTSPASLPVSAPITTESAGRQGKVASQSVMRVVCKSTYMAGTGFLHKSGRIISAAHVVSGCPQSDIVIVTPSQKEVTVKSLETDSQLDLALILRPKTSPEMPSRSPKKVRSLWELRW